MLELTTQASGHITVLKGVDPDNMQVISGFENLILDRGLREMGTSESYMAYCSIGSGTTPPVPTDTGLEARISTSSSDTPGAAATGAVNTDPNAPYVYRRVGKRFLPTGSSQNISEIGFGSDYTGVLTFNRTLVKDTAGNPTTITKLGDEYLDVIFEVRVYAPVQDVTGTFVPTGVDTAPRTYIVRARGVGGVLTYGAENGWQVGAMITPRGNSWDGLSPGPIGPLFSEPPQVQYNLDGSGVMDAEGAVGTYTLTAPLNVGNYAGGIRSCVLGMRSCKYQVQFDPPFTKTAFDQFVFSCKHSWGRR